MNNNSHYYVLIVTLIFFLSGCISRTEKSHALIEKIKLNKDNVSLPTKSVLVPSLLSQSNSSTGHQDKNLQSTLRTPQYDWCNVMQSMVDKMLQEQDVTVGSVLLVDNINNRTNGSLNAKEATKMLHDKLANCGKFILISTQQLHIAKQQLGLSSNDILSSRGKSIGLARNVEATYVLYSNASGTTSSPLLQMQLILVQTGEIIWSGTSLLHSFNMPLNEK